MAGLAPSLKRASTGKASVLGGPRRACEWCVKVTRTREWGEGAYLSPQPDARPLEVCVGKSTFPVSRVQIGS